MPGKASLLAQEYYAHPRNAFWRIMGALLPGQTSLPTLSYAKRVAALKASGIAVWDVLASCTRESSLDSDIDDSTIVPNDFAGFFRAHTEIQSVFFNGAKAEHSFRKFVLPSLGDDAKSDARQYQRLPSTSPAHAALSFEAKLDAWRVVLDSPGVRG